MSYTGTQFGFVDYLLALTAGGAGAADTCAGDLRSIPDGDKCCAWDTWTNSTYLQVKGLESLQYYNEKRVHHALEYVYPVQKLHDVAHDASFNVDVIVNAEFLAKVPIAFRNFQTLFPLSRWHTQQQAVNTDCGWMSAKRRGSNPLPTSEVEMAKASVLSSGQTYAQWLGQAKVGGTGTGADWLIQTVPGGAGSQLITRMPKPEEIYVVQDNQVKPSAWMLKFLQTFAPFKLQFPTAKSNDSLEVLRLGIRPVVRGDTETYSEGGSTQEKLTGKQIALITVLGLTGVAAVGGGLYYLSRRR